MTTVKIINFVDGDEEKKVFYPAETDKAHDFAKRISTRSNVCCEVWEDGEKTDEYNGGIQIKGV